MANLMRNVGATLALALFCGCGEPSGPAPQMPDPSMDKMPEPNEPGDVNSARVKYPDMPTYFERSVQRTCSPNFGVCHRSRQYPDMTTASAFAQSIGRRCNQLRDDPQTINNICEPEGDGIQVMLSGKAVRTTLGHSTLWPEGSTPLTATEVLLTLKDPLPQDVPPGAAVTLIRKVAGLPDVVLTIPGTMASTMDEGVLRFSAVTLRAQVVAAGGARWMDFLSPVKLIPGSPQQAVFGDPNRDGVHGAGLGGREIKPGDPAASYLYLRMIAPFESPSMYSNTKPAAPIVESQMPLANFDYWDIDNASEAMYCWIKGLKINPDGSSNALGKIDYDACGVIPQNLRPKHQGGEATTWTGIWANILKTNCASASCHDQTTAASKLDLSDPQVAYTALWNKPPRQMVDPEIRLIYPFNPEKSYLVQKMLGTAAVGKPMPLGRELPDRDKVIEAISTWINQGARNN